ncbi:MAG: hypothetical protein NVS2B7_10220 [Herpetosiphon sp.]
MKHFAHTPATDRAAYFWQFPYPTSLPQLQYFYAQAEQKVFEERLDTDPPQAARVYALVGVAIHDSFVGCWDAKYTYWAPRPSMVDSSIKPLFANPNHPSYPSSHACESAAVMSVLSFLFPRDIARFTQLAEEAALSRVAAGIHFRSDIEVGLTLGRGVGALVIAHAQNDHP